MSVIQMHEAQFGDKLGVPKPFALHKGVYAGNGMVFDNNSVRGREGLYSWAEFAQGWPVRLVERPNVNFYQVQNRIQAALDAPKPYKVWDSNCEHSANRVIYGEKRSETKELFGGLAACAAMAMLLVMLAPKLKA